MIQVKKNQKYLYNSIELLCNRNSFVDFYSSEDRKRGRVEIRSVSVFKAELKGLSPGWCGIERVIRVDSEGIRDNRPYKKIHYYISSLKKDNAQYFGKGIRSHWGIENRLHWVKDVIQNEDKSRIRDGNIAGNLSLIKSTVISLFRLNGYQSIKMAIEKHCNRIPDCLKIVNQ